MSEEFSDRQALPCGVFYQLHVPIICQDCAEVHYVPITGNALPLDGGLLELIEKIYEQLGQTGARRPTQAEMDAYVARVAERQELEDLAEKRQSFYIHREPTPGGDA